MSLPSGYEIREMTGEEFEPLWRMHGTKIFDDNSQMYSPAEHLSQDERSKAKVLSALVENRFRLRLGLFFDDEFVGWAIGDQESVDSFYMRNSAVFPGHRRRGLYTELMKHVMQTVLAAGFQRVTSRHSATNNDILIAKLKAGLFEPKERSLAKFARGSKRLSFAVSRRREFYAPFPRRVKK